MWPLHVMLLALAVSLRGSAGRTLAELPLPTGSLVSIESQEGIQRLLGAAYRADFFALEQHFESQVNGAFCGPASAVVVLNALGVPRPRLEDNKAYTYFDQANVFSNATEAVVPQAVVRRQGMTLAQLAAFIAAHEGASTSFQHSGPEVTLEAFRASVLSALAQPSEFVIANFDRAVLKEVGGGHHSPLGAYHRPTDSVLVLDVSRYKYPAWWVPMADLHRATSLTLDGTLPRGLVFVWASRTGPTPRVGPPYIPPDGTDDGMVLPRIDASCLGSASGGPASGGGGGVPAAPQEGEGGISAGLVALLCLLMVVVGAGGALAVLALSPPAWDMLSRARWGRSKVPGSPQPHGGLEGAPLVGGSSHGSHGSSAC